MAESLRMRRRVKRWATVTFVLLFLLAAAKEASCLERGFARYTDPAGRFSLDYPASMKVDAAKPEEVRIFHPQASLRINIFLEKTKSKKLRDARVLLAVFKKRMKDEMKDFSILEEGELAGLAGPQGYLICTFKDPRGIQLVQLVQYYVTKDRLLQLIISDRPKGFRNLVDVIRKIHASLRVGGPSSQ